MNSYYRNLLKLNVPLTLWFDVIREIDDTFDYDGVSVRVVAVEPPVGKHQRATIRYYKRMSEREIEHAKRTIEQEQHLLLRKMKKELQQMQSERQAAQCAVNGHDCENCERCQDYAQAVKVDFKRLRGAI